MWFSQNVAVAGLSLAMVLPRNDLEQVLHIDPVPMWTNGKIQYLPKGDDGARPVDSNDNLLLCYDIMHVLTAYDVGILSSSGVIHASAK